MRKYRPVFTLLVFSAILQITESVAQCSLPEQPKINGPGTICHGNLTSQYVIPAPGANSEGTTYTITLSGGGVLTILTEPTPPGNNLSAVHLSIAWNQSGTHTLTVTPVNACGTGPSISKSITVGLEDEDLIEIEGEVNPCSTNYTLFVPAQQGYQYQWNLNGNPILHASNPAYTATQAGSYSLTITNTAGCTFTSREKIITINPLPPALITAVGATTFCSGGSVLLQAGTQHSGLSYQWKVNGVDIANATVSSYTASSAGYYTVTITNTSLCSATSLPTLVVVNTSPTALINPASATTFCSGGSVVLNASTGTGLNYQWRVYDTPISGATNASYTAVETGLYSVTVTNPEGCSQSSAPIPVTVNSLPIATLTPGGTTNFCTGGNVVLYANTGSGLSYQWKLNDITLSTSNNSSYTAIQSGEHRVVVTNAAGCSRTSTPRMVTVHPLPTATITPAGATNICAGGSVLLNANTGYSLQYQWRLNDEPIIGANRASYTASAAGNYSVTVTSPYNCAASSAVLPVVIGDNTLEVRINEGESTLELCDDTMLTLTARAMGNNLTFEWLRNGLLVPGAVSNTLSFTAHLNEIISVKVSTPGNCKAEASIQLLVTNSEEIDISVSGEKFQRLTPYHYLFCEGSSVTLSSSASYPGFQWKKEGTDLSEATTSTVSVTEPGNYSLLGFGANGCTKLSRTVTLEASEPPVLKLNFGESLIKCVNDFLKLETQNFPSYSYQWLKDGEPFSLGDPGAKYRLTFFTPLAASDAGKYSVRLTNTIGCETTSPELTLIINSVYPPARIEGQRGNICSPNGIELRANTGDDLLYQWKIDGENIPMATTHTHYAKKAGSYAVEVCQSGCSAISPDRYIDVSTPVLVTIDGPESMCPGPRVLPPHRSGAFNFTNALHSSYVVQSKTNVLLTAHASTLEGTSVNLYDYFVHWNSGSPTDDRMVRTISSPGDYKVSFIHREYGCHYSGVKMIQDYRKVIPSIEQSGDICQDEFVTLTSSLADAYRWSTGARTRSITALPSLSYTVTTINSNGGCEATSMPFTVQPCTTSAGFQLTNNRESDEAFTRRMLISLFPNPADQTITIALPESFTESFELSIHDQLGKPVSGIIFLRDEGHVHVNTSTLSNGIYLLELETEQGTWMQKMVMY